MSPTKSLTFSRGPKGCHVSFSSSSNVVSEFPAREAVTQAAADDNQLLRCSHPQALGRSQRDSSQLASGGFVRGFGSSFLPPLDDLATLEASPPSPCHCGGEIVWNTPMGTVGLNGIHHLYIVSIRKPSPSP